MQQLNQEDNTKNDNQKEMVSSQGNETTSNGNKLIREKESVRSTTGNKVEASTAKSDEQASPKSTNEDLNTKTNYK